MKHKDGMSVELVLYDAVRPNFGLRSMGKARERSRDVCGTARFTRLCRHDPHEDGGSFVQGMKETAIVSDRWLEMCTVPIQCTGGEPFREVIPLEGEGKGGFLRLADGGVS